MVHPHVPRLKIYLFYVATFKFVFFLLFAGIKLGQFTGAVEDCTKVLKLEPENIKALLRRGTARKSLKEFVAAKEDLEAVLKAEPNNKQAKVKLIIMFFESLTLAALGYFAYRAQFS